MPPPPLPPGAAAVHADGRVELLEGCPGPGVLLHGRPNGAYTTALARLLQPHGAELADWRLHEQRLQRSLEILWRQVAQPTSASASAAACVPPAPVDVDAAAASSDGGADGVAAAALTVLPTVRRRVVAALSALSQAGASSSAIGSAGVGNGACANTGTSQGADADVDVGTCTHAFVYVYVAPNAHSDVLVYCQRYRPPPHDAAVHVAVMGPPRDAAIAHAKYSAWMDQRRHIEALRPPGTAELLLAQPDGGILEGLVTNFCVIQQDDALPGMQLVTCGPSTPTLRGIMLARVIEAAEALGLAVVLEPPATSGRARWREAFVTNCLRGLQPVSRISCPASNLCGLDPFDCELSCVVGGVTSALQAEVLRLQHWLPTSELLLL